MQQPGPGHPSFHAEGDVSWLQNELLEAHKTIRSLLRQLSKEQARYAEAMRAYNLTVENLMEITRENTMLTRDRDMWKARAEKGSRPINLKGISLDLTASEVRAIRKAMARLHHPDVGGDSERMKAWNAVLDPLEES
jgi:hypothetical protein